MKKTRVKILITGYADPVTGCTGDLTCSGDNAEIIALLFKCAVTVGREGLNMSPYEIVDLFTECVMQSDHHD